MQRVSLSGSDWQVKGYYGEDWALRDAHMPVNRDPRLWFPATVPGTIHNDLWAAGEIPNPYFERNSLLIEWVPARTWVYRKTFTLDKALRGKRAVLRFEGVDYEAQFFLNGQRLGEHVGMYTPAEFEIEGLLNFEDENVLAVVVEAAPHEQPQVGRTSKVRTHKSRMTYWWDFCPRMAHIGIWDDVYLDFSGGVRIADVFVRPQLSEDFQRADVSVSIELDVADDTTVGIETTLRYEGEIVASAETQHDLAPGQTSLDVTLPVEQPRLWYPNGYGEQPLYEAEVRLISTSTTPHPPAPSPSQAGRGGEALTPSPSPSGRRGDDVRVVGTPYMASASSESHTTDVPLTLRSGEQSEHRRSGEGNLRGEGPLLDRRVMRFGIRKVELVPNETTDPTARPYTLVVNGRRMYIKGWNWVPIDVMYGVERPEKLERLLALAQRAHVNLLRVWGGGLIEKEAFYDRCDELGIMVWQEFIQSSSGIDNHPSTAPEFIAMMVREAEQIIPRRRNHPSLAIWCGGNELQGEREQPLDDSHPLLAKLKTIVASLDPDRLWLPTSPTGRVFMNSLENIERDPTALHDVHGPWEYQGVTGQYDLYNRGTSLLHSEFGVEGLANQKALNATIAREHQFPVTLDSPIWHHLGAWWVKERMWRETFGDIGDIEALVRATQLMQADGLRYALEADRRRKYQNSGTLPWQFNEPYPMAACTSAVDYYGQPKPVYYAVAHAYEPVHVSATFPTAAWAGRKAFEAELWVNVSRVEGVPSHSSEHPSQSPLSRLERGLGGEVHARVIGVDGHVCGEWTVGVSIAPDSAVAVATITLPLADVPADVFFLDLALTDADGQLLSHNCYSFTKAVNLAPLLAVPQTTITVERGGDTLTVTNTGGHAALFVWLEDERPVGAAGFVYFDDNHFCLLPGESRTVSVMWQGVAVSERRISARGWNTEQWEG